MGLATGIMAAATLGSAVIGSRSARSATNAQTSAANRDLALQQEIYDDTRASFEPFRQGGLQDYNALRSEVGTSFQESPGYQFAFGEGVRALEGSAAAGGNLRSGATMKALTNYGQGMANQEYGNWIGRLGSLAGMGQAAAGNQAAAGANFGNMSSNALSAIGNAQSAGAIAQGNAWQGGINNALGAYQMSQMMGGGTGGVNVPANSMAGRAMFGGGSWTQ
jgi:type II secretory pathway pseudopilin PulG